MTTFCLDTNAFIEAFRYYPRDPFGKLWDTLEAWGQEGRIAAPHEVLEELSKIEDDLYGWAKTQAGLFRQPEEAVQRQVIAILKAHPEWVDAETQRPVADPWVIAQACVDGRTVVTQERPAGGPGGLPKIPNVCDEMEIGCVAWLGLVREMQLGY